MTVFNIGQENVPNDSDSVDVQNSILLRHIPEVYELCWRPNDPIKQIDLGKLVLKFSPTVGETPPF